MKSDLSNKMTGTGNEGQVDKTRRSLLKAGYVAPAIISLAAMPSFASAGSSRGDSGGGHHGGHHGGGSYSWWIKWLKKIFGKY